MNRNKDSSHFKSLRREYKLDSLLEESLPPSPLTLFSDWFEEAKRSQIIEPNAFCLATVDEDGKPAARIVLLKSLQDRSFVFFSHYKGRKGQELAQNSSAAMVFYWGELERQVRIEGTVTHIESEASDAYFASRPRDAQIGAYASKQSEPIGSRAQLEERFITAKRSFEGKDIARPAHWGGFQLLATRIEFWQGRENRMHDRIQFDYQEGERWLQVRLMP